MARRLANDGRDASVGADATRRLRARARRARRAAAGGGGERRDAAARGGRAPAARRATLQTQTQTPNRRDAASHHRRHGARARRYPPTAASACFFEPLAPPSTASLRIPRERPPDAREGRVCVRSSACVRVCALAETRATNAARSDHRAWPQTDFHQPHPAKSRGRRSFGGNDAPPHATSLFTGKAVQSQNSEVRPGYVSREYPPPTRRMGHS